MDESMFNDAVKYYSEGIKKWQSFTCALEAVLESRCNDAAEINEDTDHQDKRNYFSYYLAGNEFTISFSYFNSAFEINYTIKPQGRDQISGRLISKALWTFEPENLEGPTIYFPRDGDHETITKQNAEMLLVYLLNKLVVPEVDPIE